MADTHRVMMRLSPELYAQLTARGSAGQPLAAIVRQALAEYLTKQPEQLQQPQQSKQPARAATKQPQQPEQLQQPKQPQQSLYDPRKFILGKLCPRQHVYGNTGMSLLRLPSRNCPVCTNAGKREKRDARRRAPQGD
jgi:hypothetical protein